jgi:hypothetical protein
LRQRHAAPSLASPPRKNSRAITQKRRGRGRFDYANGRRLPWLLASEIALSPARALSASAHVMAVAVEAQPGSDGSPRYYDRFVWMYNSTAAPDDVLAQELTYSILDQDNIARGHAAYYLK